MEMQKIVEGLKILIYSSFHNLVKIMPDENTNSKEKKKSENNLNIAEKAAIAVGTGLIKATYHIAKATGDVGAKIVKGIVKNVVDDVVEDKKQEMKSKVEHAKDSVKDTLHNIKEKIKPTKNEEQN
jgi:uncharacterized membrane protein